MWLLFVFFIMMIKTSRIYYLFSIFLIPFFLFSQEKEYQAWNNLELEYKFISDVKLLLKGGVRSDFVSAQTIKYFSDFAIQKKHNKSFSYAIGYRYALTSDRDVQNRLYSDFYYKYKLQGNFRIISRSRFQIQKNSLDLFINKIRQKIKLNFNMKELNIDVFGSIEGFYIVQEKFEKIRCVIGLKCLVVKSTNLGVSFMMQQDVNIDSKNVLLAVRAKMSHSF